MKNSDLNESKTLQSADDRSQWLAMQYVLGELSEDQVEQFESAMADNVAICELVLTATKLSAGIAMVFESQHSTVSQASLSSGPVPVLEIRSPVFRDRPVFARLSVFLAMSAMSLAVLAIMSLHRSRTDAMVSRDDAVAGAFAMLLSNTQSNDLSSEFEEFVESDDTISSLVAPEWLLTAVDLEADAESADRQGVDPKDESRIF